jgi:hypothetical protein
MHHARQHGARDRAVDGEPVAEAVAGSANVAAVGIAEAGRRLDALFAQLDGAGVPHRVRHQPGPVTGHGARPGGGVAPGADRGSQPRTKLVQGLSLGAIT